MKRDTETKREAEEAAAKEAVKEAEEEAIRRAIHKALDEASDLLDDIRHSLRMAINPLDILDMFNPHMMHKKVMRIGIPIGMPIGISIPEILQKEIPAEVMKHLKNLDTTDVHMIVIEDGTATVHKKDGSTVTLPPSSDKSNDDAPSEKPKQPDNNTRQRPFIK